MQGACANSVTDKKQKKTKTKIKKIKNKQNKKLKCFYSSHRTSHVLD